MGAGESVSLGGGGGGGGGGMVFVITRELEYFFLSRKARIFFPESNNRLYDKNSESDYFFFLKIYKKDRRDLR
jgi:hypothetical protein